MKILKRAEIPKPPDIKRVVTCVCGSELEVCLDDMVLIASELVILKHTVRVVCPVCNVHINLIDKDAYEWLKYKLDMAENFDVVNVRNL